MYSHARRKWTQYSLLAPESRFAILSASERAPKSSGVPIAFEECVPCITLIFAFSTRAGCMCATLYMSYSKDSSLKSSEGRVDVSNSVEPGLHRLASGYCLLNSTLPSPSCRSPDSFVFYSINDYVVTVCPLLRGMTRFLFLFSPP
jgi:hypothetical protein